MAKDGFNYEIATKGILNAIKGYGDIQAERAQITSSILANEIKARQNLIYKMQEYQIRNKLFPSMQNIKGNILYKIANDIRLPPGERRIYDETMRRRGFDEDENLFPENNEPGVPGMSLDGGGFPENNMSGVYGASSDTGNMTPKPAQTPQRNRISQFAEGVNPITGLMNPINLIKNLLAKKISRGLPLSQKEQEWQKKYDPELVTRSSENLFPEDEVNLPADIETTSEAIEYLKDNYNMDDLEAIDWLRSKMQ